MSFFINGILIMTNAEMNVFVYHTYFNNWIYYNLFAYTPTKYHISLIFKHRVMKCWKPNIQYAPYLDIHTANGIQQTGTGIIYQLILSLYAASCKWFLFDSDKVEKFPGIKMYNCELCKIILKTLSTRNTHGKTLIDYKSHCKTASLIESPMDRTA